MKEELEDELEALRSIFEDALVVEEGKQAGGTVIEVKLKPAEDDVNGQLLFMTGTLALCLPAEYPFDEDEDDAEEREGGEEEEGGEGESSRRVEWGSREHIVSTSRAALRTREGVRQQHFCHHSTFPRLQDPLRGIAISLTASRGLSDADAAAIVRACEASVRESLEDDPGAAVVYDALEAAREALTACVEDARCSICLENLGSGAEAARGAAASEIFTTPCFHAFHRRCYAVSLFRVKREITLSARGMKLTRLCSRAPVAALLPAHVGQRYHVCRARSALGSEESKRSRAAAAALLSAAEAEAGVKIARYEAATARSEALKREEKSISSRLDDLADAREAGGWGGEHSTAEEEERMLQRRARECKTELRHSRAAADGFRGESGRARRRLEAAREAHAEAMGRLGEDGIRDVSSFPCPVCRAPVPGFVVAAGEGEGKGVTNKGGRGTGVAAAAAATAGAAAVSSTLKLDKDVSRYVEKFRKDMARLKAEREAKAERLRALQREKEERERLQAEKEAAEGAAGTSAAATATAAGGAGAGAAAGAKKRSTKNSSRARRRQKQRKQKEG